MRILTLTTDFGRRDWYVAALQGVVATRWVTNDPRRTAPPVTFVDLSHEVPPGDVATASFLLAAAAPTFPEDTVHLAVVDPGVGSERRILAASADLYDAGDGDWRRQLFVAPDNGLLKGLLRGLLKSPLKGPLKDLPNGLLPTDGSKGFSRGRRRRAEPSEPVVVAVDREELWRRAPGSTFHGRDRFAPLAAELLSGTPLATLGRRVDVDSLVDGPTIGPADRPATDRATAGDGPVRDGSRLVGRVRHIDHYGNLITDLPTSWLARGLEERRHGATGADDPPPFEVSVDRHRTDLWVSHYLEIPPGRAAALPGSLGTVELSANGEDLAAHWGVVRGARVEIHIDRATRGPSTRDRRSPRPSRDESERGGTR